MKNFSTLFIGLFATLSVSWVALILGTNEQNGSLNQTTSELEEDGSMIKGETLYPTTPLGLANQGHLVYKEMGCAYCHTQQVLEKSKGKDIDRKWGKRQSVARDYIHQSPVLLGALRIGPDLASTVDRAFSTEELHLHIYDSSIVSKNSNMPPYTFLYREQEIQGAPSSKALAIPADSKYAPEEGFEVVPTHKAEALVAYIKSKNQDYELPEIKFEN